MTRHSWSKRRQDAGLCLLAALLTSAAPAALAQEVNLDTIVVTANRRETEVRSAPAATTVITRKEIERRGGSSVGELLRDVPGVTVDDGSFPGMKRIRIRGEDARRGMVMIDGQEITDHSTYGPPILIDPALIERIEVVRGPLSVLYGSKAIGGVVNIITRKPANRPFELTVGGGYDSATRGYNSFSLASGTQGKFNYRIFLGRSEDNNRQTPIGRLPNSGFDSKSANIRLGYEDETHKIWTEYDRYDVSAQSSTPPGLINGSTIQRYQLNIPQRNRQKIGLNYDGKNLIPQIARLHMDVFYQIIDRRFLQQIAGIIPPPPGPAGSYNYDNNNKDKLFTLGTNLQIDWDLHPDHAFSTGVQVLSDRMTRDTIQTGTLNPAGPLPLAPVNNNYHQVAHITTSSLFAQDTWSFAPDWKAVFGGRYYFVNAGLDSSTHPTVRPQGSRDQRAIGSAALLWTPTQALTLRAGWGQSYVYPTLIQLHTGTIVGSQYRINPNPNLMPETSNTFELGARWNSDKLRLETSVFHTVAQNYIASISCALAPGVACPAGEFTYINASRAETYGMELAGGYKPGLYDLEAYGNLTLLRRKLSFQNPVLVTWSSGMPLANARFGVRQEKSIDSHWSAFWDAYARTATASRTRTSRSASRSGGWATLNLAVGATYVHPEFGEHRIALELTNLADKRYQPTPDELIQPGRAIRASWRSTF